MRYGRTVIWLFLLINSAMSWAVTLRVLTPNSFMLSKNVLESFERQTGINVSLIKGGDAGVMLNKLILTQENPIADVVFGIDNSLASQALATGIIEPYTADSDVKVRFTLPGGLVSIDYGYVTLNYDKAWFIKHRLSLPQTLKELTLPKYKNLLVVENPATSSAGRSFLFSTIQALGEEEAFRFWAQLRANGVKVCNSWSEAYYTAFSYHKGAYPIVVSYSSSPAAEAFDGKKKLSDEPVGNLPLRGAVFLQIEGAALIKKGRERVAGQKFIAYLRSDAVQKDLQTTMWMYPIMEKIPLLFPLSDEKNAYRTNQTPDLAEMAAKGQQWIDRWQKIVNQRM